jgi:hypothetical protein
MVRPGNVAVRRSGGISDGSIMRRVIAIAATAVSLAGCSSTPDYLRMDYYKSAPAPVQLQLESTPPGADARTSIGPGCKTPCSVSVTPGDGVTSFLVNYSMPGRQPAGVPVNVIRADGGMFSSGTMKVEPNPVMAELQPIGPPPRAAKPVRPKRKKPAAPADADPGDAPQR